MNVNDIVAEVASVLQQTDSQSAEKAVERIYRAKRIFVAGEGRSGLMAKSFAMRLMHLGLVVYVIGETTTPSVKKEDLLILVSGSGKTKSVEWLSVKAKELGTELLVFTANADTLLAQNAGEESVVIVPAATKYRKPGEKMSIQPLGSLFDQSIHLLFDWICLSLSERKSLDHDQVLGMHSNME
ncbi:6-phospho-3-hexuloisomerase [Metabacillus sp. FJAT-52054]|uniref:6-phospho-3-hexuloisomerase n=1 Tax=Metabacillus sediminis TaxID=3117746 RepID=A0ABZ2NJI3_9BACI